MKKRFIRLFMFATVIVGMGALSSCKDYDEERVDELSQKVSTLEQNLQGQIDALTARVATLETAFAGFKSCNCQGCQCGDIDQKIQDALTAWAAAHPVGTSTAEVVQLINNALANYQPTQPGTPGLSQAEVAQMIANALAGIQSCTCTCLTAQQVGDIASAVLADYMANHPYPAPGLTAQDVNNIVNAAIANFVTQQQLQAAKQELTEAIETAKQQMEAALANKADKSAVEALQTAVNELNQKVADALGKAQAAQQTAEAAQQAAQQAAQAAATAQQTAEGAQQAAAAAQQLAESNKARLDALEQFKQQIEQLIPQLEQQLTTIATTASEAKTLAEANATQIQAVQTALNNLADELRAKDQELANAIDAINEKIKDMATKEDIAGTLGYALDLFNKAIALSDQGDEALQDEIDQLENDLNTLKNKVQENTNAIAKLNEDLQKALERATGIVLQGTNNPMFGSFALPFGIQSNLLVALKGENVGGAFVFPNPSFIADPDAETYLAGQTLMNEEGNAGTLYVTVNPAEVDFTGTTLSLENSLGEASPIKLGALKQSEQKLTFGLTRAATTGFYECTATLDPADFDAAKFNVDEETLKNLLKDEKAVAKALIEEVKGNATSGISTTINDLVNVTKTTLDAFKLDALAARGTWTDELGEHSILSQFGIAATAVAPLNFTSLDALGNFTSFPGFNKLAQVFDNIYDKIADGIKGSLNDLNVSGVSINHITLQANGTYVVDLSLAGLTSVPVNGTIIGTTVIPGDEYEVKDAYNNVIGKVTISNITAPVNGTANAVAYFTGKTIDLTNIIQDIFGDATASLGDVNDMIDDLNDLITSIDNMTTNVTSKLDNGKAQIVSWMDKINNGLTKALNKLPKLTKPALVVVSDNGAALAGHRGHRPTCTGEIKLIPTTYSCEYLAPVFKKVVTVNGQKQTINADGTIDATNIQTGENEIKYAALDYAGNEIDMTYYINVE